MKVTLKPVPGGAIGNYLFHLNHAVLFTRTRRGVLEIPPKPQFKTLNRETVTLDLSNRSFVPDFADRTLEFFVHGDAETRRLGFREHFRSMRQNLMPLLDDRGEFRETDRDTLVIHVRSGDIFKSVCNAKYGTPPLSWFRRLIESSDFRQILLVTQTRFGAGGQLNPVVEPLLADYSNAQLVSESVEHDFHTLRHAYHLALSPGTFSLAAAILSTNLQNLHVPFYPHRSDVNFGNRCFASPHGYPFRVVGWRIADFLGMRRWSFSDRQMRSLEEHPVGSVWQLGSRVADRRPDYDRLYSGSVVRRSGRTDASLLEDGGLLLRLPQGEAARLNVSAAAIWELCDGSRDLRAVEDALIEDRPDAAAEIRSSVPAVVRDLMKRELMGFPKIFGIGLPRTATRSLHRALMTLGFPSTRKPAFRVHAGRLVVAPGSLADFDALVGAPIAAAYRRLDRDFPGSRFVMTTRPIEEWLQSMRRFLGVATWSRDRHARDAVKHLFGVTVFDEVRLRESYERHQEEVLEHFADRPEDLLVFDASAGHGWQRLSGFLGVEALPGDFPHVG